MVSCTFDIFWHFLKKVNDVWNHLVQFKRWHITSLTRFAFEGRKTQRRTSERNWTSNFISVKWVALGWFLELRPRLPLNSMIAINLMKSSIMSSLSLNSLAQWKLPYHLEFVSKGFILLFFLLFSYHTDNNSNSWNDSWESLFFGKVWF